MDVLDEILPEDETLSEAELEKLLNHYISRNWSEETARQEAEADRANRQELYNELWGEDGAA